MSPSKYVREACKNCKEHLSNNLDDNYKLPKQAPNPFVMGYEAELDTSTLCDPQEASYFQSITGVMRWMIEIDRVDIATEVSILCLQGKGSQEARKWCHGMKLRQ